MANDLPTPPATEPAKPAQEAPAQSRYRLPDEPPSPGKTAAITGGVGLVAGAGVGALWDKVGGWIKGTPKPMSFARIGSFALNVGIVSALVGYVRGQDNTIIHGLLKENEKMQDHVEALTEEKDALKKSFVTFVQESKTADKAQSAPTPGRR